MFVVFEELAVFKEVLWILSQEIYPAQIFWPVKINQIQNLFGFCEIEIENDNIDDDFTHYHH